MSRNMHLQSAFPQQTSATQLLQNSLRVTSKGKSILHANLKTIHKIVKHDTSRNEHKHWKFIFPRAKVPISSCIRFLTIRVILQGMIFPVLCTIGAGANNARTRQDRVQALWHWQPSYSVTQSRLGQKLQD
jgi:hypothetical protein